MINFKNKDEALMMIYALKSRGADEFTIDGGSKYKLVADRIIDKEIEPNLEIELKTRSLTYVGVKDYIKIVYIESVCSDDVTLFRVINKGDSEIIWDYEVDELEIDWFIVENIEKELGRS